MLTITLNNPVDFTGNPRITEGEAIQWRVASSDPALFESVQIAPSSPNVSGGPQTVNFVAGGGTVQFVTFTSIDDKTYEVDERFSFNFNPIGGTVLNTRFGSGPLLNNDLLPGISIKAQQAILLENTADPTFRFDVERTGDDLSMVTNVELAFVATGVTPIDQADLASQLGPQFLRFEVGETTKRVELTFRNDSDIEATETMEARIVSATSTSPTQFWSGTQFNPVTKYSASVALLNDDPNAPVVNPNPGPGQPPVVNPPVTSPASPAPIDVYRFFNDKTQSHFFTASPSERDIINNTLPDYKYEGVGFQSVPNQAGADPIFRFYNVQTNTHFFTPSVAERDSVIQNLSSIYSYEGTGFYASDKDGGGLTEVFRFYNTEVGVHFYTPSVLERNIVQATLPAYRYEGVGFYVPDSPSYDLIG